MFNQKYKDKIIELETQLKQSNWILEQYRKNQPYIRLVKDTHLVWLDVAKKLAATWFQKDFINILENAQHKLQDQSIRELYWDSNYAHVRHSYLAWSYSTYSTILDYLKWIIKIGDNNNDKVDKQTKIK